MTETILVIDDNAQNRAVLEGQLVAHGYAVCLAESGARGLALFQERAPDLVLLDVLMPEMDGFETCRRLRALPLGGETPIVFVTALTDLGTHEIAMKSGADDFLTKPVMRTELLLRVRSLLRIHRMSLELRASHDVIRGQRDLLLRTQQQKEELTALVVHDLKNPLAAILANSQYLVGEPYLKEDDHAAMLDVVSSADSMHRMIMNLLDISKSEEGALLPKAGEVDLAGLVQEIGRALGRRLSDSKLALAVELGVDVVRADKDLLRRVLENLLDNCVKYAPSGGALHIRSLARADGFVEIRVCDQGSGVPEAQREKIFEKYAQLDRDAQSHARNSRGLGLSFCRLATEAHGGKIWVEQNHPQGSAFCFTLPDSNRGLQ